MEVLARQKLAVFRITAEPQPTNKNIGANLTCRIRVIVWHGLKNRLPVMQKALGNSRRLNCPASTKSV
jgi:hypothetical protein